MTEQEIELIKFLQEDIPLTHHPFLDIAKKLKLSESEVIDIIAKWKESGIIRRLGAIIRHYNIGFTANGMAVWKVAETDVEKVGEIMASFPEVTHCYERVIFPGWDYNLYTMIHSTNDDEVKKIAEDISAKTGIKDYNILFTTSELKKTDMKYFGE